MGVEVRSFTNGSADLESVGNQVADWLMQERGFALTGRGWSDEGYRVRLEKSGFLRQASGLVYTTDLVLQRQGSTVVAKVDDGDLRNQVVALGMAFFFVIWPALLTAGYGWMQKGEVRREVLDRVGALLR
jgi:hypothetical protein